MITLKSVGFVAGPLLAIVAWVLPAPEGMSDVAHAVMVVGMWMAIWWITEAIPIGATALIPIVAFPLMGVGTVAQNTAPYANPIIYLFLGGFLLAAALERSNLHRRIALNVVSLVGFSANRLILGFLLASALLSMWISNTATALMMLPIAFTVGKMGSSDTGSNPMLAGILLAVTYGCSIGGLGTLIGTPPNAIMAAYLLQAHDIQMGFGEWMVIGVPLVLVSLPVCYFVLKFVLKTNTYMADSTVEAQLITRINELGRWSPSEKRVFIVFATTAVCWMFQPKLAEIIPGLTDTGIAIIGAIFMFLLPDNKGGKLLMWNDAEKIPWGILLLFGGGLSLADAVQRSELAVWMGAQMSGLGSVPLPVLILLVSLMVIFLTEITSNTATAAALLPVMGALSVSLGYGPLTLVIPAALAASCAFMLPVATPPNAIVYATGRLRQSDMVRAGFWLNIAMAVIITIFMTFQM
jgi:solute carrier family 13 (sodium-dependent dicarboxylate transporter), member 2/3/5